MSQQDYLLDFLYRWHYLETKPNSTEPKFRAHRFYHEEGSIEWRRINAGNTNGNEGVFEPSFQYTIRDHLGNGRVYFTKDYNGDGLPDILQESHYYPFGAQIEGLSKLYDPPGSVPNASNGYVYVDENSPTFIEYRQYTHDLKRYNGKEFNRELGLNWYDYGARWYDPVIGRWNAVDPLAEEYYRWSPFNYVLNNPLRLVDPDGRSPGDIYNNNGVHIGNDGKDDQRVFHLPTNSNEKLSQEEALELTVEHDKNGGPVGCGIKVVQVDITNDNLNIDATLLTIRETEGHGTPTEYNTMFGGSIIDSYDDHPRKRVTKWGHTSSAAGAYQFLEGTWDEHSEKLGLTDFSPKNQDRAAVGEINKVKGAMNNIKSGNYSKALRSLSGKWTSLPGGRHQWKNNVNHLFLKNRASIIKNTPKIYSNQQ